MNQAFSFHSRFLTTLAAAGLLTLSVNACSKKKEATPENVPAPSASAVVDPNADGKRLERAINDWKRRWERIDLESCEALLKEPADLEACKKAEGALAKVKEYAAKLDKSPAALTAAGELILASEAVVEKLRAANIVATAAGAGSAKPGGLPAAAPKTIASAAKKAVAPKASGSAGALASAAPARKEDPATKLVSSYERTARSAARYLGSFLQQGTLDVRKQAFGEVQRLVPLREKWLTLRDVVRQASLTERDADLKKQLRDLEQKLRGSAPPPPAAGSALRPAAPPPAHKEDDGHGH
ncbi:MAG TPA: hypothetical protein VM686_36035 [Polyangiaceae bacterium]|nr:hypothetical protein [Polyangiaceae bacterium]